MRCDPRGVDYRSSGRMIKELLSQERAGATGFSVIGADVFERYFNRTKDYASTVVVVRAGTEQRSDSGALVVEGSEGIEELSSTKVRAAMRANDIDGLREMVGDELGTFLLDLGSDAYVQ